MAAGASLEEEGAWDGAEAGDVAEVSAAMAAHILPTLVAGVAGAQATRALAGMWGR